MTYEGLRLKIKKQERILFANKRKKELNKLQFTIISNNCWGGMIYESYNLPKQSPTVGCFFMADDYIKFVCNLKENIETPIKFINPNNSKYLDYVSQDKRYGSYPVGKINDIEIFFLHYKNNSEVIEKWKRRINRISWDHIIIKFNDQNLCNKQNLKDFLNLPYKNKLFFTVKDWKIKNDFIFKIKQHTKEDFITASHEPFGNNRNINITKYINNIK